MFRSSMLGHIRRALRTINAKPQRYISGELYIHAATDEDDGRAGGNGNRFKAQGSGVSAQAEEGAAGEYRTAARRGK